MSKLSLSVEKASSAHRALALVETPAQALEVETLAAAAKRYAKSLEVKQPEEVVQKGQAILLQAAAHQPRWNVAVVSGITTDVRISRVTSRGIEVPRRTTVDEIRLATVRWLDGGPWLVQASVPIPRPTISTDFEAEIDAIMDKVPWPKEAA